VLKRVTLALICDLKRKKLSEKKEERNWGVEGLTNQPESFLAVFV